VSTLSKESNAAWQTDIFKQVDMAVMVYKSLNQYTEKEAGILTHRNKDMDEQSSRTDVCSRNKGRYIKTKANS
jgi:hypothetical protein